MKNTDLLQKILKKSAKAQHLSAESVRTTCVFDLDSTLFNVAPRTEQILKEYAQLYDQQEFTNLKVHPKDWGLKEILIRQGYDFSASNFDNIKLHKKLVDFWSEKFFSNKYLHYDTPYLGAVHFVQTLCRKNIDVHFLTGRDIFRMGSGTYDVLLKWGFPILTKSHLHLKPHKEIDDHKFKLDWVIDFKQKHPNTKIFFFENEPVNINAIGLKIKDIELVYMDSTHSRKETVFVPVTTIENFVLSETIT